MLGSHISLFSGVGMTDLAAEKLGFKTIATAEIDPWCRKVLAQRFPDAEHFDDVRKVRMTASARHRVGADAQARKLRGPLLISGGFPCQDVSSAGTGQGLAGSRSGLWAEFARVIREFRPEYVLIENSPMLRSRGLNVVLLDLADAGYSARWDCIPAASVGAPHLRDRIFIVAIPAQPCTSVGILHGAVDLMKLPRAGRMERYHVTETTPLAPIKEAKKACLAHAVPCPATPTGAWPTPAASNPQDGESAESWMARRELLKAKGVNGNGAGMPLNIAVKLYPTPTTSDGSGGPGTTPKRTGGKNLRTVVGESDGNGRLNPEWVEWMMGLPGCWTDPTVPNDSLYDHMGWQSEHGIFRTVPSRLKDRTKRIRALGNGLVPQAALAALTSLSDLT